MGLLSSLLSALGLGASSSSSAPPSVQSVSTVAAEMSNAVAATMNEAANLTSAGLGYAAGVTTSTVGKLSATLTSGILNVGNDFDGMLSGVMPFDPATLSNTLSSDGQYAASTLANYATQMPMNVASGIAQGVQDFQTNFVPTDLGGYLFF